MSKKKSRKKRLTTAPQPREKTLLAKDQIFGYDTNLIFSDLRWSIVLTIALLLLLIGLQQYL